MFTVLTVAALAVEVILLVLVLALYRKGAVSARGADVAEILHATQALNDSLNASFTAATADMAARLENTKGDLRQQVSDRLDAGFSRIRSSVEEQLAQGRQEQAQRLTEARTELTASLALTTHQLKNEFDSLNQKTAQSLDTIRARVDEKLLAITDQVQKKLDENIKEGFAQFEKVQQHLKAAEEQLREVGALGHSINDLNNLLKLPHLRGTFGEASLERLLSDFLPAHMFEMQAPAGDGNGRVDAMIYFPDRRLPIDAKFPREQVLALFESDDPGSLEEGRRALVRVIKAEAKRIKGYIRPEQGTTDVAFLYLPSETLYMEVVRNRELADWLNQQHVYPASPNTLLMMLKSIALVQKWYEVAGRFEKSRLELAKAQKSFDHFQNQFENVGKSLGKAQEAFETAQRHLKTYRGRVSVLSGQEQLDLDTTKPAEAPPDDLLLPISDKASA
jgi:DNA recombination protein RmuC